MKKISLPEFRKHYGLTQEELARLLNVSRNYIAMVENGRKPLSSKLKDKLSLVNTEKLSPITFTSPNGETDTCPHCAAVNIRISELEQERDFLRKQLSGLVKTLTRLREDVQYKGESKIKEALALYAEPRELELVRCYESIPAGDPREVVHPGQTWIAIDRKAKESWYALRVDGDSMEPAYKTGDIVLIDHDQEPMNGRVIAALIDGTESTLKTYSRCGDEITLTPINTFAYSARTYHASRVTIQGVLIDVVKRVK